MLKCINTILFLTLTAFLQPLPTPIAIIKKAARNVSALDLQNEYIVEGFFYKDPIPLLLTQMKWSQINTPMPDSVYIVLGGPFVKALVRDLAHYQGRFMRFNGKINGNQDKERSDFTILDTLTTDPKN